MNGLGIASRLMILFAAHEVDHERLLVVGHVARGEKRLTKAFRKIAQTSPTSKFRDYWKRSRQYRQLLLLGGPGLLLEMGKHVAELCVIVRSVIDT